MNLPRIGIPPVPREDIQYASFADEINEQAAAKFIHWMDLISLDSNSRQTAIHMLFNSTGGSIVDALNMRGYVGGYPSDIPITMFNTGGVQSAAVLVFLSAGHVSFVRMRSSYSTPQSGRLVQD